MLHCFDLRRFYGDRLARPGLSIVATPSAARPRLPVPRLAFRNASADRTAYGIATPPHFTRATIHRVPPTVALSETVPPSPASFSRTKKLVPAPRVTW